MTEKHREGHGSAAEPRKTPGKAEGGRNTVKKPALEPGRTPGKAEGERDEETRRPG